MAVNIEAEMNDFNAFIAASLKEFRPFAYYDKHLDCIRVQIRDCSVVEDRLSQIFTVLRANHAQTTDFVGFTIKGVRHLFESLGMAPRGIIRLVDLLERIVVRLPHTAVKTIIEEFTPYRDQELEVNFAEAA